MNMTPPEGLLGKTITGMVIKRFPNDSFPNWCQVYLLFSDETAMEIYYGYGSLRFRSELEELSLDEVIHYGRTEEPNFFVTYLDENGKAVRWVKEGE